MHHQKEEIYLADSIKLLCPDVNTFKKGSPLIFSTSKEGLICHSTTY